ncbi:hypothetical protein CC77DRAFT_400796 [Alternaria alternata]|jgi:hypothetical protein|uniref:Uncharacterized protein n=2 Tax=Alternaria alternata complex TaxID=187734 RepID=A0A177D9U6_ALTAL|nr:hypothetical protein CC77DRAFT_400796 [Alternaria alternata]RII11068.1 hypothetical protein CUC08_Gglean007071 [Alternaria sp. MG1]RYN23338.1 hypothetical protein AA0115_g8683 [Alternaria tenuissima]KAH6860448.1 hypothetical protein B0T12DRAFT_393593 [Alternaria alternata]KAH8642832.1 hypothetical protein IG631_00295 [Alternaria alternata]OAG16306.1 hypothetical protein CC77DRAFT_400796 [Alternaria alternata]
MDVTTTINTQSSSASSLRSSSPTTPITPSSPASSAGASYFNAPNSPQIPYHIIVTFDGKVREMMRIERQVEYPVQERRSRRPAPRPRYYAKNAEEQRPEAKRVDSGFSGM